MAPRTAADIAELQKALEKCCADLAEALVKAEEAAAEQLEEAGPTVGPDGEDLPRWRPLILAPIPGLDQLVSIIKPPLQIIVALLQVIAAILQIIAAILIGLPDPFRALILAAYELLVGIINDLLNTGAYMYIDAPGIHPTQVTLAETGLIFDPGKQFKAGQALKPPPVTPDGFERWATRFQASFDDPGDLKRPVITEGAPIQAVFIVMAAPSLDALRQAIYLIGKLFNISAFKKAFEQYAKGAKDPRLSRIRTKSVKPDWMAIRLRDLFPPLEKLLLIPEALLGLLAQIDTLSALIKNLAAALQEKAQVLLDLAAAIQAIIDLLDLLKSSGMYGLAVSTTGGIPGLKQAFLDAIDRPPGGYIGGICFLASGPNLAKAAMLWELLGMSTMVDLAEGDITLEDAFEQARATEIGQAIEKAIDQGREIGTVSEEFASEVEKHGKAFVDAVTAIRPTLSMALGLSEEELLELARSNRDFLIDQLETCKVFIPNRENLDIAIAATKAARRHGSRSLTMVVANNPDDLKRVDKDASGKKI